ncbi:MAG: class I SAM-dependent methyltransferase [Balneolaceae bacterium]
MKKGNISYTAAYIVVKFYGLTLDPKIGKNFDPSLIDFYEKMVRFLPKHLSWYHNSLTSSFWRKLFIFSEELLLPGDLMHIVCRKYYMTALVDKAITEGVEQFVSLGSGFDHLGAYASSKGVPSYELDMDFMVDQKQKFLEHSGLANEFLHVAPIDVIKQRIPDVLKKMESFSPNKKTAFICEGFFDYLPLQTTEEVLGDIKLLNPDNQLISTFFSLDELNWFHRLSFTSGVTLVGESLKLPLNRMGFHELLKNTGFSVSEEFSYDDMRKGLVEPSGITLPVLKGFYVMSAD